MQSIYHGEQIFLDGKWLTLDLGLTHYNEYRVQLGDVTGLCIATEPTVREAETKLFNYAKEHGFMDRLLVIHANKTDPRNVLKQN